MNKNLWYQKFSFHQINIKYNITADVDNDDVGDSNNKGR